jgi:hypothetical protein
MVPLPFAVGAEGSRSQDRLPFHLWPVEIKLLPVLQLALTDANRDVVLAWHSQPGWGYHVQWSSNLIHWNTTATLSGGATHRPMQYIQTYATIGPERFLRLQVKEGGF